MTTAQYTDLPSAERGRIERDLGLELPAELHKFGAEYRDDAHPAVAEERP